MNIKKWNKFDSFEQYIQVFTCWPCARVCVCLPIRDRNRRIYEIISCVPKCFNMTPYVLMITISLVVLVFFLRANSNRKNRTWCENSCILASYAKCPWTARPGCAKKRMWANNLLRAGDIDDVCIGGRTTNTCPSSVSWRFSRLASSSDWLRLGNDQANNNTTSQHTTYPGWSVVQHSLRGDFADRSI